MRCEGVPQISPTDLRELLDVGPRKFELFFEAQVDQVVEIPLGNCRSDAPVAS